jgi:hypothetical protein
MMDIPYSAKVIKPPEGAKLSDTMEPALDAKSKAPQGEAYIWHSTVSSDPPKKKIIYIKKSAQASDLQAKKEEDEKDDKYTPDILRIRYNMYRDTYIKTAEIIETSGLPIRHQNPPEDVTENIVKFIINNYDNDTSCKWAKSMKHKSMKINGDLYSDKYPIDSPPEVKAFTSDGPSSFGPKKKFGVIYFLDMRGWLNDTFILWKVDVSNDSPEWKNIKMNKKQTNEEQCEEGRRPHISWDNIHSQMPDKCIKVYEGIFEDIFKQQAMVSVAPQ